MLFGYATQWIVKELGMADMHRWSGWIPRTRCSCFTLAAAPATPRASCTPQVRGWLPLIKAEELYISSPLHCHGRQLQGIFAVPVLCRKAEELHTITILGWQLLRKVPMAHRQPWY